jgi:integration host factor subunit beta
MTKKEIVKAISEKVGLTQLQAKEVVQMTFDAIVEMLAAGERVELRNFGVFDVKHRVTRKGRNPKTGIEVMVPEKYVVIFKPGKEMGRKVDRLLKERAVAEE